MSTKILFVIEDDTEPSPDRNRRTQTMVRQVQKAAEDWLAKGGVGVLALSIQRGMRLKVYQVGPEALKEPPTIEVRYKDDTPVCFRCGAMIAHEDAAVVTGGEVYHSLCVPDDPSEV